MLKRDAQQGRHPFVAALGATTFLYLSGCTAGETGTQEPAAEPEPVGCSELADLPCEAELIDALSLQDGDVSPQDFVNVETDGVFSTDVDATAGGLVADPRQSFLYGKFTANGLEKVAINDMDSLQSADWDIAFHRYIIRLNGGSSGPSCVQAATTGDGFDDVTTAPTSGFLPDDQFTDECVFRATEAAEDPDNEQDFGVVLAPYYDYVGCLSMTGETFTIALASGEIVKFGVTHFYEEQAQQECNELGSNIPIGSANIQVQWAFLD